MAELFGFKFERINKQGDEPIAVTPDDASYGAEGGGYFAQILDQDGKQSTELDLIKRYREISQQPEVDSAIEDIVNEAIVSNERDAPVAIVLDQLPYPEKIRKRIREEFDTVLELLDFNEKGHDIFRRWYVDGRLYYHKHIDEKNPRRGLMKVNYIDPRKIRKVKKKIQDKNSDTRLNGKLEKPKFEEYFLYNEKGLGTAGYGENVGVKLTTDSVCYVPSGLTDHNKNLVLSYLHKAIKPTNQLRMIEDSLVIYRISRAPERRIFYIDVGNLPKQKAEAYLKDIINRYRNKLTYDAKTGEIKDDRNHMSMLEDFWLPRREGGRGTEITTLPGGQNLGEIDDIVYFQRKLYRSLNVPISRLEAEQNFSLGRSTEITRDELKFTKFVQRARKKFIPLFQDMLKTQLILKGVINTEEWKKMKEHVQYDFLQDGHFAELKQAELLQNQIETLQSIEPFVGTFFSKEWIQKNVLRMTDYEIEEMQKQIKTEAGTDPEEGGIEVPKSDGITRVPSFGGDALDEPEAQLPNDVGVDNER